jgi:hypothetical protein
VAAGGGSADGAVDPEIGGDAATKAPPAGADAVAPAPGLLIVRTGTLHLEGQAIGPLVERVTALIGAAGGYVAASKETGSDTADGASLDVRIPAVAWDRTLAGLRALGTVREQDVHTEEVTGQVVDLDARVANLRATEAALQAIMARATKINDVLDVQGQLTTTRGAIEQLVAKAKSLRDRAAFGSLTLALTVPVAPAPAASPPPGWDPARDVDAASHTVVRIGQSTTSAGIWLAIVGVPILVSIVVALGLLRLGWLVARRFRLVGSHEPA